MRRIIYCTLIFYRVVALFQGDKADKTIIIPFMIPTLTYTFGGQPFIDTMLIWSWIILIASTHFAIVGVNAAHHRPDIFHDGDSPR